MGMDQAAVFSREDAQSVCWSTANIMCVALCCTSGGGLLPLAPSLESSGRRPRRLVTPLSGRRQKVNSVSIEIVSPTGPWRACRASGGGREGRSTNPVAFNKLRPTSVQLAFDSIIPCGV